tara:strand:- start:1213 stop:1416 length:204 start_codon:yes stop_codon:yes gene_type:complete
MNKETAVMLDEIKKSGFTELVNDYTEEVISASKTALNLTKTMPRDHHMYDEPSNVYIPTNLENAPNG